MAELLNDDLLLVNRDEETYTAQGEALYGSYLVAPEIASIDLVESDPGVLPRFTDQEFLVSVTMAEEGKPISEKTIDAYVEGSILENVQFIEPLESINMVPGGWNAGPAAEDNSWTSVTYGDDKFVAVASDGTNRVMYSTDGINWTSASAAAADSWRSVTYGDGKFVAVAASGTYRVMYSLNGIDWTRASAAAADAWYAITYGDDKFVAVGGSGAVMYSTDAINWTSATAAKALDWQSVTYEDGKFVAVASTSTNQVMYSTNGINWTSASATTENTGWFGVTYADGKFVAVGNIATPMYSTNGINWTAASPADHNYWYSVTYGNGKFVAVARSGDNRVMWSTDAINWTAASAAEVIDWNSVTYGGDKFVAVAANGTNRVMWSYTGANKDPDTLVFAAGTDMSTLAPGDTVTQTGGTQGIYSATSSPSLVNPERMFDGNDGLFTSIPADGNRYTLTEEPIFMKANSRMQVNAWGNTGAQPAVYFYVNGKEIKDLTGSSAPTEHGLGTAQPNDYYITKLEIKVEPSAVKYDIYKIYSGDDPVSGLADPDTLLVEGAPLPAASGTVGSITDTTVSLASSINVWTNGVDVTGPAKQVVVDNAKKYLEFDSAGNVTDLLDTPQSPAYVTTDEDPTLTLKFPSTFPSGFTPDEEIGEGATLTACVTATNSVGSDGPVCDTVQPAEINDFTDAIEQVNKVEETIQWSYYVGQAVIISEDGLSFDKEDGNSAAARATGLVRTTGKYYYEIRVQTSVAVSRDRFDVGWGDITSNNAYWLCDNKRFWSTSTGRSFVKTTHNLANNGTDYIHMCAIDYDRRMIWYGIDGVWYNNETPGGTNTYFKWDRSWSDVNSLGMRITHSMGAPGCQTQINPNPLYAPAGFSIVADYDQLVFETAKNFDKFHKEGPIYQLDKNANGVCKTPDAANRSIVLSNSEGTWKVGEQCSPEVVIRSLTAEELEAQRLKFLTYDNRKDVVCGETATAARATLEATLLEAGYDAADIAQAYSNLDN